VQKAIAYITQKLSIFDPPLLHTIMIKDHTILVLYGPNKFILKRSHGLTVEMYTSFFIAPLYKRT